MLSPKPEGVVAVSGLRAGGHSDLGPEILDVTQIYQALEEARGQKNLLPDLLI